MENNPCETCLRWGECNGVDRENCNLVKENLKKMDVFVARTLEPCPGCGAKKHWVIRIHGHRILKRYYVECPKCGWCSPTRIGMRWAKAAWNRMVKKHGK